MQDRTCEEPEARSEKKEAGQLPASLHVLHACTPSYVRWRGPAGERMPLGARLRRSKRATEQVDKPKQQGDQGRSAIHPDPGQRASNGWVCTAAAACRPLPKKMQYAACIPRRYGRSRTVSYASYHCSIKPRVRWTAGHHAPRSVHHGQFYGRCCRMCQHLQPTYPTYVTLHELKAQPLGIWRKRATDPECGFLEDGLLGGRYFHKIQKAHLLVSNFGGRAPWKLT